MTYEEALTKIIYEGKQIEAINVLIHSLADQLDFYKKGYYNTKAILKAVRKINAYNEDVMSRREGIAALTEGEL